MKISSVIIDSREPVWLQDKFQGISKVITMLPAGDLWVATDDQAMLCIERKSPNDFLNSLRDDRIFGQCAALREQSTWAYLLISGVFLRGANGKVITDRTTEWDWNAVQGGLLTIQELGVHVTCCAGDHDVEQAVIRLANRRRGPVHVVKPRLTHILSDAETIIASLPGIGPERLATIDAVWPINECAYMALCALTDPEPEQWDLVGIGKGITQRIRKTLGLSNNVFLTPVKQGECHE